MLLLIVRPTEPPPPPPVDPATITKGRKAVVAIVQAAPTGARSLAWWQQWLADHWT